MPQVEQEKRKSNTTLKVVIVVLIIVLAVGAGVGLFLYQRDQDRKAVRGVLDQWQTLVLRGRYDEALKRIDNVYPRAHSKQEQLDLLYYKGATNVAKGDMRAVQTSFKAYADAKGGLTYESARQLGYAAAQLGQKREAIDYYKQAIELFKKSDNPRAEAEIRELENRIRALEAAK